MAEIIFRNMKTGEIETQSDLYVGNYGYVIEMYQDENMEGDLVNYTKEHPDIQAFAKIEGNEFLIK